MAKRKKSGSRAGKFRKQQARTKARRERRQVTEAKLETLRKQNEERRVASVLAARTRTAAAQAYAAAQEAAAERLERTRLRNDRSARNFARNVGLMMEGKPSGLKRKPTEATPFKGIGVLYATEKYWRGQENGYKNWTEYARQGIAKEKGVDVRDVNLWTEISPKVDQKVYEVLVDTMQTNGEVTIGPGGVPIYKGKELSTVDDLFQAMKDTANYSDSDIIALIRSAVASIRW